MFNIVLRPAKKCLVTLANYKVAWILASKMKPYLLGREMVKKLLQL